MLRNGATPIPIKRQHLGNENCAALVASGYAAVVPPIIDDIADFLYWLQELDLPMHLRCIYNVVARNLLRVCIEDEEHIHPFQAHHIGNLFRKHLDELPFSVYNRTIGTICERLS
jgi:hypothetical protein